jgi:hypothetical protein
LLSLKKKTKLKSGIRLVAHVLSTKFFTKLATGLKRLQLLKETTHAKDYAIKPKRGTLVFIAFPFALIQSLWL